MHDSSIRDLAKLKSFATRKQGYSRTVPMLRTQPRSRTLPACLATDLSNVRIDANGGEAESA
jgi:hypothetical protein